MIYFKLNYINFQDGAYLLELAYLTSRALKESVYFFRYSNSLFVLVFQVKLTGL